MAKPKARRGGAPLKAPNGVTGHTGLFVRLDPERRRRLDKLVAAHRSRSMVAMVAQADVIRLLIDEAFEALGVR